MGAPGAARQPGLPSYLPSSGLAQHFDVIEQLSRLLQRLRGVQCRAIQDLDLMQAEAEGERTPPSLLVTPPGEQAAAWVEV